MKRILLIFVLLTAGIACAQEPAVPKGEPSAEPSAAAKAEEAQGEKKPELSPEEIEKQEKAESKDLIYKWINFAILAGLMIYFLRKPASDFFAARTAAIQKDMAEAKVAREDAERRLAAIEAKLSHLMDDIAGLRNEAAREDAAGAERLREASEAEGAKIKAQAESEIDTLTRASRLELKAYAAKLAVDLAEERIKARMNSGEQEHLLQAYVTDLSKGGGKN